MYSLHKTLLITNFLSFTPAAEIADEQFTHTVFAEEFTEDMQEEFIEEVEEYFEEVVMEEPQPEPEPPLLWQAL